MLLTISSLRQTEDVYKRQALQGSLSNFAGGVLILLLKPFVVGDYIIEGSNEGTVYEISVFYTKLKTVDNKMIVIPNGNLSNSSLVNVSHMDKPVSYTHLAESEDNCAIMAVKEIRDYMENGNIVHSVNFPDCSMGACTTAGRIGILHRNVSGMISQYSTTLGRCV